MSSGSRATTSHQGPKYQGYPYVNPPAFGVPTIDPHTAARWANLPRRPIGTAVRVEDQAGSSSQRNQIEKEPQTAVENKQDSEDNPVVYIDIPDSTDNSVCEARNNSNQSTTKTPEESISYRSDDEPVLYIDLPDASESDIYDRRDDTPTQNSRRLNVDDEEPVVYIDIPECSGSGVSERQPEVEDGHSTTVVQETIYYDQFKDRRIDVIPVDSRNSDDNSSSNNSSMRRPFVNSALRRPYEDDERVNSPPQPPTSLGVWSPGTSYASADAFISSGQTKPSSNLPFYLTQQQYQEAFRRTPDDDFSLSPLPVTDFPEPPPAYSEFDLRSPPPSLGNSVSAVGSPHSHVPNQGSPEPITEQPQRTTVIVNEISGLDRKYLMCKHCRVTVQSIVVREASLRTHLAALSFLMCGMVLCAIMVYCFDCTKGKAHYCPNCNKKIRSNTF